LAEPPASRQTRPAPRPPTAGRSSDAPRLALGPGSVGELCARADEVLDRQPGSLVCDAHAVADPDLATVETVARLALTARRRGRDIRLQGPPRSLIDLLDLCGLAELLAREQAANRAARDHAAKPADQGTSVEAGGESEQREEALGVEEERDPGDPVVLDLEDLDRPRLPAAARRRLVLGEPGGATGLDRDEP
jgi:ABC-type transporter Mla MlaB component